MKKVICFLLAALLVVTSVAAFTGCGSTQEVTCKVTFDMDGTCPNVVIEVKKGEGIAKKDVPEPPQKEGYTVKWDREDFSNITENVTVRPVYTPVEKQKVKVNFMMESGNTAVWANWVESMTFVIGEEYSLPVLNALPKHARNYEFTGWKYEGKNVALKGTFNDSFAGREITFVLDYVYYTNNY